MSVSTRAQERPTYRGGVPPQHEIDGKVPMTSEQKIRSAVIAGEAAMLALLIPFALWLGVVLP